MLDCVHNLSPRDLFAIPREAQYWYSIWQVVDRLAGDIPVFIDADDWEATAEEIDDRFLGDAEIW